MKEYYIFYFIVNGVTEEMVQLRFLGTAGQNKWLHFQNVKTKENHLCSPNQFPEYTIKNREFKQTFRYEEDLGPGSSKVVKRPPDESKSRFFKHYKRWI